MRTGIYFGLLFLIKSNCGDLGITWLAHFGLANNFYDVYMVRRTIDMVAVDKSYQPIFQADLTEHHLTTDHLSPLPNANQRADLAADAKGQNFFQHLNIPSTPKTVQALAQRSHNTLNTLLVQAPSFQLSKILGYDEDVLQQKFSQQDNNAAPAPIMQISPIQTRSFNQNKLSLPPPTLTLNSSGVALKLCNSTSSSQCINSLSTTIIAPNNHLDKTVDPSGHSNIDLDIANGSGIVNVKIDDKAKTDEGQYMMGNNNKSIGQKVDDRKIIDKNAKDGNSESIVFNLEPESSTASNRLNANPRSLNYGTASSTSIVFNLLNVDPTISTDYGTSSSTNLGTDLSTDPNLINVDFKVESSTSSSATLGTDSRPSLETGSNSDLDTIQNYIPIIGLGYDLNAGHSEPSFDVRSTKSGRTLDTKSRPTMGIGFNRNLAANQRSIPILVIYDDFNNSSPGFGHRVESRSDYNTSPDIAPNSDLNTSTTPSTEESSSNNNFIASTDFIALSNNSPSVGRHETLTNSYGNIGDEEMDSESPALSTTESVILTQQYSTTSEYGASGGKYETTTNHENGAVPSPVTTDDQMASPIMQSRSFNTNHIIGDLIQKQAEAAAAAAIEATRSYGLNSENSASGMDMSSETEEKSEALAHTIKVHLLFETEPKIKTRRITKHNKESHKDEDVISEIDIIQARSGVLPGDNSASSSADSASTTPLNSNVDSVTTTISEPVSEPTGKEENLTGKKGSDLDLAKLKQMLTDELPSILARVLGQNNQSSDASTATRNSPPDADSLTNSASSQLASILPAQLLPLFRGRKTDDSKVPRSRLQRILPVLSFLNNFGGIMGRMSNDDQDEYDESEDKSYEIQTDNDATSRNLITPEDVSPGCFGKKN